jgi:Hemolysin-type calcium-binding repeat (2 copies).
VSGDLGNDRLIGGDGNDTLNGGDGNDRYVIDGLGNDTIDDPSGADEARCLPGVTALSDNMSGADRVLSLSTGGSVRIVGNRVEQVLGCK